jgi:hypothetical protein
LDFNVSGNRKDFHILRIEESLALDVPKIDTLSFSYSETDFRKSKPNTSNFDCEALSLQMTVFTYSRNSGNKKERLCTRYQKFREIMSPS